MRTLLTLTLLSLAAAGTAATPAERFPEIKIPFVNSMSNVEWKAASDDSLYLRGPKGDWYFVTTTNSLAPPLAARRTTCSMSGRPATRASGFEAAMLRSRVPCPAAMIRHFIGAP